GVYEIEYGSRLGAPGGAGRGGSEPVRGVLLRGVSRPPGDAAQAATLHLSRGGLRSAGASLGAGIIVVLPRSACPVAEVTRVAEWMKDESASQCGPCVNG